MLSVAVREQTHVAEARRSAVAVARNAGFSEGQTGCVAIVATELATNLLKHARGGEFLVTACGDGSGEVICIALDQGPGMSDMRMCLQDGYSTAGSSGTGLGAVLRQSHGLDIFSRPGLGTAVLARFRPGAAAPSRPRPEWGALSLPKPGETASGDRWAAHRDPRGATLMVADGLGHGMLAAEAAQEAVRIFLKHAERPLVEILDFMHAALRATRGAAISLARLDLERRTVGFAGIGNVAGVLIDGATMRKMVSHNGTVGHAVRKIQAFDYPFSGVPLVILHSDGLSANWTLDRYPGLAARHPALIAAILYRDYKRGRDDVTVASMRGPAA